MTNKGNPIYNTGFIHGSYGILGHLFYIIDKMPRETNREQILSLLKGIKDDCGALLSASSEDIGLDLLHLTQEYDVYDTKDHPVYQEEEVPEYPKVQMGIDYFRRK